MSLKRAKASLPWMLRDLHRVPITNDLVFESSPGSLKSFLVSSPGVGLCESWKGFTTLWWTCQGQVILKVIGQTSRKHFRHLWVSLKKFHRHAVVFGVVPGAIRALQVFHSFTPPCSDIHKTGMWASYVFLKVLDIKIQCLRRQGGLHHPFRASPIKTPYYQQSNTTRSNSWMGLITYIVNISSHIQNEKLKAWM